MKPDKNNTLLLEPSQWKWLSFAVVALSISFTVGLILILVLIDLHDKTTALESRAERLAVSIERTAAKVGELLNTRDGHGPATP